MAISIFHCWACGEKLTHDRGTEDYFFWCDKACHDKYEKDVKKSGRKLQQWSDYMCGEGPCPKGMEPLPEAPHSFIKAPSKKKGAKPQKAKKSPQKRSRTPKKASKSSGKRKAARTVKRIRQLSDASTVSDRSDNKKRTYKCGICGKKGHNARRCEKVE